MWSNANMPVRHQVGQACAELSSASDTFAMACVVCASASPRARTPVRNGGGSAYEMKSPAARPCCNRPPAPTWSGRDLPCHACFTDSKACLQGECSRVERLPRPMALPPPAGPARRSTQVVQAGTTRAGDERACGARTKQSQQGPGRPVSVPSLVTSVTRTGGSRHRPAGPASRPGRRPPVQRARRALVPPARPPRRRFRSPCSAM